MAGRNDTFDIPTGLDDFFTEATDKGEVVGAWGFNPDVDFTSMGQEETNVWFFEQVLISSGHFSAS